MTALRRAERPHARRPWRAWRRYRALLGLGGLAALVLGYWELCERQPPPPAAGELQLIPDRSLPTPGHRVLEEITIAPAGAAPFSLHRRREKGPAGYYLTPTDRRADDAEVESLLSALLSTLAERRLLLTPTARPDSYGLGAKQCRVVVRFGAGHALCFGAEAPSGSVYVRLDDSPVVLVVDQALFALVARPPTRYRANRLVLGPLTGAHQLALGPLSLRQEGDLWRVQTVGQRATLAEPAAVDELLRRLAAWPVSSWPADRPPTAPPAAPAHPPLVPATAPPLRLVVDGAELWLGGWPCPGDAATQLFVRGDGEPVCAEPPAARRLLPPASELRAQRLVPLANAQVTRLAYPPSGELVRTPDGTYTQSGQRAETASVHHILDLLTQTRSLAPALPTLPPPTAVRLEVSTTLGQTIALRLWARGGQTLGQRDDEPVQVMDESLAELLGLSALTFAPLPLLALEAATVHRIDRRGPLHERLERAAGWQLREPTAAPADGAAVAGLLTALSDLRAERWVSARALPEQGLDPPRLRLAVQSVASAPELIVELGGAASARGDCYVRRPPATAVAVLSAPTCATLRQPLLSPLLLRLDEDRLTDLQLQPGQESPFVCTRRAGLWRCNDRALAAVAQHALLAALHALERGESPTYEAAPAAPPRWVLQLRHSPLSTAPTKTSAGGPAVEAGEEVAPQEQTLRLYPAADGGLVARLDARGVSYRLPPAAATALQESLAAWRSAQP